MEVVERWNQYSKTRHDLFNVFDLVAMLTGVGIMGVQVTSTSNLSARRKKLLASQEARTWIECGGRVRLHGWSKKGPRGKRKTWCLTEQELTRADFDVSFLQVLDR